MRRLLIALAFVCSSATLAAALGIPGDPSSCGIELFRGETGVLLGDLDCTGQGEIAAIVLHGGAAVNLNGYRVSNDLHGISCYPSVSPSRTCTITGPGEITNSLNGIAAASKVRVTNVTIHGNDTGIWKIYGDVRHSARVDLKNVVIRDNAGAGLRGGGAINATDTTIRDNGDVGLTSQGPSRLRRTTITGNGGAGIIGGIFSDFYQEYSYSPRALSLTDSDVSGNGVIDGSADLLMIKRPRLLRSTCGTSANPEAPGNPTWGVCAGD
jgi:hypothetical protein